MVRGAQVHCIALNERKGIRMAGSDLSGTVASSASDWAAALELESRTGEQE